MTSVLFTSKIVNLKKPFEGYNLLMFFITKTLWGYTRRWVILSADTLRHSCTHTFHDASLSSFPQVMLLLKLLLFTSCLDLFINILLFSLLQVEPNTKLFPAVFVRPTSPNLFQFELSKIKVESPQFSFSTTLRYLQYHINAQEGILNPTNAV